MFKFRSNSGQKCSMEPEPEQKCCSGTGTGTGTGIPVDLCLRVTMVLPYLGPLSVFIKRCLTKLVTKFYPLVDLKIIYKRGRTIGSMFPYKDNFP